MILFLLKPYTHGRWKTFLGQENTEKIRKGVCVSANGLEKGEKNVSGGLAENSQLEPARITFNGMEELDYISEMKQ